ncbi:MAG: GrpB family protein [Clostridia bacterium]|nr:GrpB family protein [Clostridia bacterium]
MRYLRIKKLTEMTLDELWQLFPIFLTEHQPYWIEWYNEEVAQLKTLLPSDVEYHHIGSTAVNGIMAKPIVDIIIETNTDSQLKEVAETLHSHDYIIMSSSENRISLNKGYTEYGFAEKVFHLHIRLKDDIDEVYFRDYLNAHPDVAKEYEELKLRLWKQYEHNRDAYTNAKTSFVKKFTGLAISEFKAKR